MWDSACSDKSRIASSPLRLRTPSARPCVDSQSPDFSSTILESYATCLKAQILPPTYFCIKHFLTLLQLLESCAICLKAPESSFPSLRGEAEAIHKNNADSSGLLHCVRNDGKATDTNATILSEQAKDSSPKAKTAQNLQSHNATNATRRQDFAMILGVVERKARAHTRAYVTAALRDDSLKSAQNKRSAVSLEKPTPKLSQILTYKESK